MHKTSDYQISAQVILYGSEGRPLDGYSEITSDNIKSYLPDGALLSDLDKVFTENGFNVGNAVGISFSVTGPKETFERFLGCKIYTDRKGVTGFITGRKRLGTELGNEFLPETLRPYIKAIVFTPPPDFGPTEW